MANVIIGALRVLLGVDTASFETGLKSAERSLSNFSKGALGSATAAKLAISGAVTAISASMQHMINEADNIGKASQKFGVPVEQLSALKYAADLADVSFEALGKGLNKLNRNILEGVTQPTGEAAKSFRALGVSIRDASGNVKSNEAIFADIADKFEKMPDGVNKSAIAIRIFGRGGADLIPLLNQGSAGLKEMTDRARELGIVISAETAAKSEKFNDTMKDIWVSVKAISLRLAEALLPHLQKLAEWLVSAAREGGKASWIFKNLVTDADIKMLSWLNQVIENIARGLGSLKAVFLAPTWEKMKEAFNELGKTVEENQKKLQNFESEYSKMAEAAALDAAEHEAARRLRYKARIDDINKAALAEKSAIQQFIDSTKTSIEAQELEAKTMALGIGEREKQMVLLKAEAIERAKNITMTAAERAEVERLGVAAQTATLRLAGAKMTEENLTSWEVYEQKIKAATAALEVNGMTAENVAKTQKKAAAAMIESYAAVAENAAGAFSDFFKTFAGGSKKMFLISKALAISQATIHALTAFNNALAMTLLPPPFPQIAAAAALAAGMAQVGKIAAEKPPAFATGGAMRIGGTGGLDSQMVSFMGSPGETVRVDQNKYGEGGSSKTITLAGINPRDYYRGDVLRDLFANMNEALSDGAKLKIKLA